MVLVRAALHLVKMPGFQLDLGQKKRTIIVGNPQELSVWALSSSKQARKYW
jgi:hypothetical protein